jgi:DNA-binding FadR family transcriptional regulator
MESSMTILRKAKNKSLVQDVSQQIETAIISGEYRPGDRLPSTRELQEILGASLGTIRESLAILEQKGFLEVRKGSKGGFFVCETSTKPMISSLETLMQRMVFTTRELYEFRIPVEAGLTGIVAQKADGKKIRAIKQYLKKLEGCLNKGNAGWLALVDIEQDLRREFLIIADNQIYDAVLRPIVDNLCNYALKVLPGGDAETLLAYESWVKIIQCIEKKDPVNASRHVSELLSKFMDIIVHHPMNDPEKKG